jgi:antitoxin component YwqK of YwqJK toxin-antitoxin module
LTWWDEQGRLKQSLSFDNGIHHGKWFQWDKNGQKRFEGEYNRGTWVSGSWWTASGRLLLRIDGSETLYVNHNHISYHGKGFSNPYYKGKPFSGTIIHFDDGVLISLEEFKEGKRQGKYICWDEDGNILK